MIISVMGRHHLCHICAHVVANSLLFHYMCIMLLLSLMGVMVTVGTLKGNCHKNTSSCLIKLVVVVTRFLEFLSPK